LSIPLDVLELAQAGRRFDGQDAADIIDAFAPA
jgi:hypothetical protein